MNNDELLCPECGRVEPVSAADPDASYDDLLNHIRTAHPGIDQRPEVLWPRIELRRL